MQRLPSSLSVAERLIIRNQLRILEKVDLNESEGYAVLAEILENGYRGEYGRITQWCLFDGLSEDECEEVREILYLYRRLQEAYEDLGRPDEIEERELVFGGFDGNNETTQMGYLRFIRERLEEYKTVKIRDYNSHMPSIDKYRRMLQEWQQIDKRFDPLSVDEIRRILDAGMRAAD